MIDAMRTLVALLPGLLVVSAASNTAHASQLLWTNGAPASVSTNCDSTPDHCPGGDGGWTIYDNFTLSVSTLVVGLTFDSSFAAGSSADYLSSNWSIWDVDPMGGSKSLGPLASGSAVASLSTDSIGATQFSIGGLNLNLSANTYWLGYENVMANNSDNGRTSAVLSSNTVTLAGFEQASDNGAFSFHYTGNTVFTIEGPAPEPATWGLVMVGLAYIAKRRLKRERQ
jgi:hypothetical protein